MAGIKVKAFGSGVLSAGHPNEDCSCYVVINIISADGLFIGHPHRGCALGPGPGRSRGIEPGQQVEVVSSMAWLADRPQIVAAKSTAHE